MIVYPGGRGPGFQGSRDTDSAGAPSCVRLFARGWRPERWVGRSSEEVESGALMGPNREVLTAEAARPPTLVVGPGSRLPALAARVKGAT